MTTLAGEMCSPGLRHQPLVPAKGSWLVVDLLGDETCVIFSHSSLVYIGGFLMRNFTAMTVNVEVRIIAKPIMRYWIVGDLLIGSAAQHINFSPESGSVSSELLSVSSSNSSLLTALYCRLGKHDLGILK